MIVQEKINKTKQRAEAFYKTIEVVYCPYFHGEVVFNSRGLEHIKFKGRMKSRSYDDQYTRFRFIKFAPEIIRTSHTPQGIKKTRDFEREKINSRWETVMRDVIYYEFIAVIEDVRIKIIIKQVENGPKFFWSIIPFWKIKNKKRKLHDGNPRID